MTVAIVNYNIGNLASVQNMLKRVGVKSKITADPLEIEQAERIIIPGVGHFDFGMRNLHASGLVPLLNQRVLENKVPVLGICLGVQLLTEGSEEGSEPGLGWVKGRTIAFDKSRLEAGQKIPHMGWGNIQHYQQSKLFTDMYEDPRFYFVHSFHLSLDEKATELCHMKYGYEFCAGIEQGNVLGTQFHPEKSHKFGMKLLENFVKYY